MGHRAKQLRREEPALSYLGHGADVIRIGGHDRAEVVPQREPNGDQYEETKSGN